MAFLFGSSGAWAAGTTRTLTDALTVPGYKAKQFYNFQNNTPEVLPTSGDLRYRDGNVWGLHNFGSGTRSGTASISVSEGDLIILQHYSSDNISTINRGTLNNFYTSYTNYQCYDITTTATDITFTIARYGGIVAAFVMEVDPDAPKADFTINYNDESNNLVKSTSGNTVIGLSVSAENSFWVEDVKYINDNGGSFEIGEGDNNFNVTVRQAAKYAWTAKSSVGNYSISGETFEGEKANAKYPLYVLSDGKLWTKPATNKEFNASFDVPSNNYEYELTYSETEIDAIFYVEAEDVNGMTIINSGNAEARSSQRAAGYAASSNVVFTTLAPGKYKLVGSYYSPSSGGGHPIIYTGNRIIVEATTGNSNGTPFEGEFVVAKESNEIAFGKGGGNAAAFDYVYIQKLADATADELAEALAEDEKADTRVILDNEITKAKALYNEDLYGADVFNAAITAAEEARDAADATTDSYNAAIETLKEAEEIFKLGAPTTHTVNLVDDKENVIGTTSANGFENDESVEVTYPKYIKVGDTLYAAEPDATTKSFRKTLSLVGETEPTIAYTATSIVGVTMLQEGEDLTLNGNESYWGNNGQGEGEGVAYSQDKVARLGTSSSAYSAYTDKAGIFNLTVMGRNRMESEASSLTVGLRQNGTVTPLATALTWDGGEMAEKTLSEVEVPAGASIVFINNDNKYTSEIEIDYFYLKDRGEKHSYTVKAVSEDEAVDSMLAEGSGYANDAAFYVAYPRYINVNGTLYQANTTDKQYRVKVTLEEDRAIEVAYAKTRINGVVFLTEAQKLEGKAEAELTELKAGNYKLTAATMGAEGTLTVTAGEEPVWSVTNNGTLQNEEAEFELTADANLTIANGGETEATVDYLYIQVAEKPVEPEPEPETDHVNFVELDHVKSTAENPEAGIVSDPIALSQGSQVAAADEESGLSLWATEDGAEMHIAEGKSFFITPPAGKALHEIILKGRKLNLKASNGKLSETEPEVIENPEVNQNPENGNEEEVAAARKKIEEEPIVAEEPVVEEPAADEEETIYWTGNIDKVKFTAEAETSISSIIVISEEPDESTETYTEEQQQPEDELLAEAKALAEDTEAVAVGKLTDAIAAYEAEADKEALTAAIEQFKKDNEAQENDQTAKVKTDGWKKYDGTNAGVCATQFAPAIDTYDGRKDVQLAEVYETTVATTGTIIYQDITGLQNGQYKVGFYGNAFFTSGRGFDSDMADGAEDVAYVFANDQKEFIVSNIATSTTENNFRTFNVDVTDGAIKLGMGKEKPGTNWHTMQIYQLTWVASAKDVYANDLAALKAAIAVAKENQADELKTEGKEALAAAIEAAEAAAESNMLNISELEAEVGKLAQAINDFQTANLVTFEGKYYIQHVASGKFMAAGHNWGTRGIVNAEGLDLTLTADDNKKVTIDSRVANNETNHFLGSGLYMDAGAFGWTIEKLSDDSYAIGDGTKYLTIDADDNLTLADEGASWKFVAAETLETERLAANMATLAAATKDNGVDATFLIKTPQFNRNDQRNAENWTVSEDCTNKNLGGGCSSTEGNGCAESYHSVFTISQLVAGAPKGTYRMTAQGFYRQDGETTEATPLFFMNDATAEVPVKTGSENSMTDAGISFTAGEYTIEPIEVFVDENGTLTVGIKNETAASQWIIFDNFRLTYFGEEDSTTPKLPKYTVNEVIDGQVVRTTEGQAELGTTVKVPYRHYNVVEGKLYSKGVTSKEYNYSFKFEADGQEENISGYTATGTQDIVFLAEGEDIKGLTPCTSGNTAIRSSNSASAYAADADVEITKLPAGTYKLTAAIFDASKNPNSMWYFIAGTDTIAKLNCTAVNYQERSSDKFTLEAETSIMLVKGGNANMGIDLVYIQAVEAETPIFSYTVNEMIGETAVRTTEGKNEKAAVVKVPFREYNVLDGKLYKKSQISKEFNYSFTLNNDNQTENLEYTATEVENVVFLKEGEDIEGLTQITTGNSAIRSSNSAAGYAAEGNVEFVTLPAGVYTLTAGIYDSSKTPDSHWKFLAGEQEIADLNCTIVNIQELTSDEFTLTQETKLYIAQGGASNMGIDFIYIVKTGEATPDGISAIKAAAEKGAVYDMQGRKQSGKLRKGLYIMDGKVISVK